MRDRHGWNYIIHTFIIVLLLSQSIQIIPAYAEPSNQSTKLVEILLWKQVDPTSELLANFQEKIEKQLSVIPKETQENSLEGQHRAILKERVALIIEWRGLKDSIQELHTRIKRTTEEQVKLQTLLDNEVKKAPPHSPTKPTPDGLQTLQATWVQISQDFQKVQDFIKERQSRMATLPEKFAQTKERKKNARKEADKFIELAGKETDQQKKTILAMQAENAHLQVRLSDENLLLFNEEQRFEKETVSSRDQKLELVRLRHQWHEKAIMIYRKALTGLQNDRLKEKEVELQQKAHEVEQAVNPSERFTKHWETEITRLQKNIAELNKLKTDLSVFIALLEKQLRSERDELKNLKDMVKTTGLSEQVANILKNVFRRIEIRRQTMATWTIPKELITRLEILKRRLFEINSTLPDLRDRWNIDLGSAMEGIEPNVQKDFKENAKSLFSTFRKLLSQEKQLLLELDVEERRLSLHPVERREVLKELESFVLSNVFWIQDAVPIRLETIQQLLAEMFSPKLPNSLFNWWLQVLSKETLTTLFKALQNWKFLAGFLFLTLSLPVLFMLARSTSISWRTLLDMLLTAYLLISGFMIGSMGLPVSIGIVTQYTLWHVAIFTLISGFNQLLFAPTGYVITRFGVPEPVNDVLYRSLRLVLLTYLICLLPWIIFKEAPFHFEALPRLGFLFFEVGAAIAVLRLIQPSSPLVQHAFGLHVEKEKQQQISRLGRYWPTASKLAFLFIAVVIGLDAFGYRFSAKQLANSGLLTIVTLFGLIGCYHLIMIVFKRFIHKKRIPASAAPGQRSYTSRADFVSQVQKPLRFALLVLGILLLTDYWGLDESIFLALGEVTLYSVTGKDGTLDFITLADLTRFLLGLTLLIWVVRHLPKIFEILIFSRVKIDSGLRYAVVTMTRYLIFLVGLFVSFSFLKLDLAKVGWLVAAISVGLGFGLQEIVANFVSGIILLVERPIRVGDTINVGISFGKVTRINIRSTTILTPDLQELLIPNRDLITKEVTNWTLGNANVRQVVPIGIAYGSDIDLAIETLLNLARQQPEVLKDPAPEVLFMTYGPSSLGLELRIFLNNPSLRMPILSRINRLIYKAFHDHGIEIPFPQQDVHIRSGLFPVEQPIDKGVKN